MSDLIDEKKKPSRPKMPAPNTPMIASATVMSSQV